MVGAVQQFLGNVVSKRKTDSDGQKQSKKRLKRGEAQCLTSDEVIAQMQATQEANKKKAEYQEARK